MVTRMENLAGLLIIVTGYTIFQVLVAQNTGAAIMDPILVPYGVFGVLVLAAGGYIAFTGPSMME